uniref:AlNc14C74G5021 protein n=1 Tax=Albugo laibachii Nc14 TaxID=890382 RepID=F0WEG7_9STRA|nr:AlNc14C74G5021 [Albugo laibachii Nc14]|eukprot:CCA19599.1 AlNc14C74G5021 [Albugo laibachii Nc14]
MTGLYDSVQVLNQFESFSAANVTNDRSYAMSKAVEYRQASWAVSRIDTKRCIVCIEHASFIQDEYAQTGAVSPLSGCTNY